MGWSSPADAIVQPVWRSARSQSRASHPNAAAGRAMSHLPYYSEDAEPAPVRVLPGATREEWATLEREVADMNLLLRDRQ